MRWCLLGWVPFDLTLLRIGHEKVGRNGFSLRIYSNRRVSSFLSIVLSIPVLNVCCCSPFTVQVQ